MINERIGLFGAFLAILPLSMLACSSTTDTPNGGAGSPAAGGQAGSSGSPSTAGATTTAGAAAGGSAGAVGTAGAGGAAGGSGVTALDGSKTLGSLSAEEGKTLCDDSYEYFAASVTKDMYCKWSGLAYAASSSSPTDEKMKQACTGAQTDCQTKNPWQENLGCSALPMTCTQTVSAYSACMVSLMSVFKQQVSSFPGCDTVTLAGSPPIINYIASDLPPECQTIMNACPEVSLPTPQNQ